MIAVLALALIGIEIAWLAAFERPQGAYGNLLISVHVLAVALCLITLFKAQRNADRAGLGWPRVALVWSLALAAAVVLGISLRPSDGAPSQDASMHLAGWGSPPLEGEILLFENHERPVVYQDARVDYLRLVPGRPTLGSELLVCALIGLLLARAGHVGRGRILPIALRDLGTYVSLGLVWFLGFAPIRLGHDLWIADAALSRGGLWFILLAPEGSHAYLACLVPAAIVAASSTLLLLARRNRTLAA